MDRYEIALPMFQINMYVRFSQDLPMALESFIGINPEYYYWGNQIAFVLARNIFDHRDDPAIIIAFKGVSNADNATICHESVHAATHVYKSIESLDKMDSEPFVLLVEYIFAEIVRLREQYKRDLKKNKLAILDNKTTD